jgi:lysophospholipase L1-like esterase
LEFTPLPHESVRIDGALGLVRAARGVSPRRLPNWAASRIEDAFLAFDIEATAGVRLAFRTESSSLALTLNCQSLQLDDLELGAAVDLVVDGRFVARREVGAGGRVRFDEALKPTSTRGEDSVVTFVDLGTADKSIELWLPHTATTEVVVLETDAPVRAPAVDHRPIWIHYGSSISHCLEAPGPTATWPARASMLTNHNLIDLGFAGQAVLDPVVSRAIRETPADFISLKLGINIVGGSLMRERTFGPAVEGFIDTIREGHPTTPIQIISAIACPRLEWDVPNGELSLARSREILAAIAARRKRDGESVSYLDGRELLSEDEADDLPDGLHPSPAAYLRMADRYARMVPRIGA